MRKGIRWGELKSVDLKLSMKAPNIMIISYGFYSRTKIMEMGQVNFKKTNTKYRDLRGKFERKKTRKREISL